MINFEKFQTKTFKNFKVENYKKITRRKRQPVVEFENKKRPSVDMNITKKATRQSIFTLKILKKTII